MARYGAVHLLTKYNNPTIRSRRILINSKSYYHPYEMMYGIYGGWEVVKLVNITKIGNVGLRLTRSQLCLVFDYHVKNYTIKFIRRNDGSFEINIGNSTTEDGVLIYKDTSDSKFVTHLDSRFFELADAIVEPTLSEIYKNHLFTILSILEI